MRHKFDIVAVFRLKKVLQFWILQEPLTKNKYQIYCFILENIKKEIIDLDITQQVVLKQGELLEHQEVGNQQPSIYRNIIEGSTTNERVLIEEDIERR